MANRGTKRSKTPKKSDNWTGKGFAAWKDKLAEKAKDIFITTGRGTGNIKLGDVPKTKKKSNKGKTVSSNRGTSRRKL